MSPQPSTPVPASGLPAGVERGPLGSRLVAQLIDLVIPVIVVVVSAVLIRRTDGDGSATGGYLLAAVLCLIWFVVVWWMFATRAAGPGMRVMKLQLVGLRNGRPIGWGRYLVRAVLLAVLSLTVVGLVLDLVLLVRQPRHQGWHDLAADSVVIKRRPLAPSRRTASKRPASASPARAAGSSTSKSRPAAKPAPVPAAEPAPAAQPAPVSTSASAAVSSSERAPLPSAYRPAPEASPNGAAAPPAGGARAVPVGRSEDSVPVGSRRTVPGPSMQPGSAVPPVDGQHPTPAPPEVVQPLDEGWVAVLDDGRYLEITGLVLLGRNPQPRAGEEDAELVKVADETRTVSKTHLSLSVDASGLFVMDRGSTNGTTVTSSLGVSKPCPAGVVVAIGEGVVSFGDHWLQIERLPVSGRSAT